MRQLVSATVVARVAVIAALAQLCSAQGLMSTLQWQSAEDKFKVESLHGMWTPIIREVGQVRQIFEK